MTRRITAMVEYTDDGGWPCLDVTEKWTALATQEAWVVGATLPQLHTIPATVSGTKTIRHPDEIAHYKRLYELQEL